MGGQFRLHDAEAKKDKLIDWGGMRRDLEGWIFLQTTVQKKVAPNKFKFMGMRDDAG